MNGKAVAWFFAACFTLASLSLSASAFSEPVASAGKPKANYPRNVVDGDSVPRSSAINYCLKYWPQVIRESRYHIGMDAPAHDFMGQIEIESRCVAGIISEEGSKGLGQFMPDTAAWLQKREKALQKIAPTPQPLNPRWSIRAVILFDRWLYQNIDCEDWHYVFRAYNGGLELMNKEIARAGTCEYKAVEKKCRRNIIKTKAGKLNLCTVNINYPLLVRAAGEKYEAISVKKSEASSVKSEAGRDTSYEKIRIEQRPKVEG